MKKAGFDSPLLPATETETASRLRDLPIAEIFPAPRMPAIDTLNLARTARGYGDIGACVSFAERAYGEAEGEGDRETMYHACACIGRAYMGRGEPEKAAVAYVAALKEAKGGLHEWLPMAHHDLYLAFRESGRGFGAKIHAGTAMDLYWSFQRKSPRFAALTADRALESLQAQPCESAGRYVVDTFRAAASSLSFCSRMCLISASNVMMGASVAKRPQRYGEALKALDDTFPCLVDHEGAALVLVQAAHAASLMEDFPNAARLAEKAVRIAARRSETAVTSLAIALHADALAERKTPVA